MLNLRRGQPTCHIAFDTATAILTGDALQPLAFEVLASHPAELTASQRLRMIEILPARAGCRGWSRESAGSCRPPTADTLELLCRLKTGALLNACSAIAIIAANTPCAWLNNYTDCIGLAFQIQMTCSTLKAARDAWQAAKLGPSKQ